MGCPLKNRFAFQRAQSKFRGKLVGDSSDPCSVARPGEGDAQDTWCDRHRIVDSCELFACMEGFRGWCRAKLTVRPWWLAAIGSSPSEELWISGDTSLEENCFPETPKLADVLFADQLTQHQLEKVLLLVSRLRNWEARHTPINCVVFLGSTGGRGSRATLCAPRRALSQGSAGAALPPSGSRCLECRAERKRAEHRETSSS